MNAHSGVVLERKAVRAAAELLVGLAAGRLRRGLEDPPLLEEPVGFGVELARRTRAINLSLAPLNLTACPTLSPALANPPNTTMDAFVIRTIPLKVDP